MSALPYIDLWLLDFEWPSSIHAPIDPPSWLGVNDRARLEGMGHPRRRAEFLLGRRLLRHALQSRFGSASHAWQLHTAEKGRPHLHSADPQQALPSINLSHCRSLIACAIGSPTQLGLDVECLGRTADFDALSARVLHPLEREAIRAGGIETKESDFLRYWTLKEALAKAIGVGITLPMRQYGFVDDTLAAAPPTFDPDGWGFQRPLYRPEVRIALAWKTPTRALPEIVLRAAKSQDLV